MDNMTAQRKGRIEMRLNQASHLVPPSLQNIDNDINFDLMDINVHGDLILWSNTGRLCTINLFRSSSNPQDDHNRIHDIICEPPLPSSVLDQEFHRIQFNTIGDRIFIMSKAMLYVIVLPFHANSMQLQKDPHHDRKYLCRMTNGPSKVMEVSASVAEKKFNLNQIKMTLEQQCGSTIQSINQEIYTAKAYSVGYFEEAQAPKLMDCQWHPVSEYHLAVLTEYGTFSLFNTFQNMVEPEQNYDVEQKMIAFDFGAARGWEKFTVYFMHSNGDIYALCPIVPYQCKLHQSDFIELQTTVTSEIMILKKKSASAVVEKQLIELHARKYWLNSIWRPMKESIQQIQSSSSFSRSTSVRSVSRFAAPDSDDDSEEEKEEQEADEDSSNSSRSRIQYESSYVISQKTSETGIGEHSWPIELQGPIQISPTSALAHHEGTGGTSARSIRTITAKKGENMINSNYPILSRAFSSGHLEFVLLHEPISPAWKNTDSSIQMKSKKTMNLPKALLLEALDLGVDDSGGAPRLLNYSNHPELVYLSHSTGIYMLHLEWLDKLNSNAFWTAKSEDRTKCSTRRLFSLSPTPQQHQNLGIVGMNVIDDVTFGHTLVIRLSDGRFEVINISANRVLPSLEKSLTTEEDSTELATIATPSISNFALQLEKISARQRGQMVVKGNTPLKDVHEASVEFMIDTIKDFQDSKITTIEEIGELVQNRVKLQKDLLHGQTEQLESAVEAYVRYQADQEKIAQRLAQAQAIQANLQKRSAAVLQAIRDNQPYLSKAEIQYRKELKHLQNTVEQTKPKVTELDFKAKKHLRDFDSAEESQDIVARPPGSPISQTQQHSCHAILEAESTLLGKTQQVIDGLDQKLLDFHLSLS